MKNEAVIGNKQNLNLKNFDIVLINFVEESKKDELLKELSELYGEYQPIDSGVGSPMGMESSSIGSPDLKLGKRIIYYDAINNLKKALPEKFLSLEIRIVNHIPSWCEVICKGRLKQEHLQKAKEEFSERIAKENTVSTPKTFEEAHKDLESYLSPHIMENIIHRQDSEKRRSYPYLYIGEAGVLASKNLKEIIKETNYTTAGIAWFVSRWASVFEGRYLIEQTGGGHSGLILRDRGFSILNISPVGMGKMPSSWDTDTKRRFRAIGSEYEIVDTVSLILLTRVLLTYRLEEIKYWEKGNILLSGKIRELSSKFDLEEKESEDALKEINSLQKEIGRLRSTFLGESFDLRNECEELQNCITFSHEYLLSRDYRNSPIEVPFFYPVDAKKINVESHIRSGHPKRGVLSNVVEGSQHKSEELLKKISKIEEEQTTLTSFIHDVLNINLQKSMRMFSEKTFSINRSVKALTIAIAIFTFVMVGLIVIQTLAYFHII